jgi:hypothetical protein
MPEQDDLGEVLADAADTDYEPRVDAAAADALLTAVERGELPEEVARARMETLLEGVTVMRAHWIAQLEAAITSSAV